MKLIGSATSPYVRKVRIVMAEKKLDYQFILEDVWAANTTITASNLWRITRLTTSSIVRIFYDPNARKNVSGVVGSYETTRESFKCAFAIQCRTSSSLPTRYNPSIAEYRSSAIFTPLTTTSGP